MVCFVACYFSRIQNLTVYLKRYIWSMLAFKLSAVLTISNRLALFLYQTLVSALPFARLIITIKEIRSDVSHYVNPKCVLLCSRGCWRCHHQPVPLSARVNKSSINLFQHGWCGGNSGSHNVYCSVSTAPHLHCRWSDFLFQIRHVNSLPRGSHPQKIMWLSHCTNESASTQHALRCLRNQLCY